MPAQPSHLPLDTPTQQFVCLDPIKIALVAGEASGDTLGADLITALSLRYPNAQFVGIGGEKMQQAGLTSWYAMEMLSVMGFFEVLKRLRSLLALRKELIARLLAFKPDVFIGIDAPDFNFKVEEVLKQHQIPAIHYVGPSVWAWREGRLNKIKSQVTGVLVLFPFEAPLYHRYQIPVQFVGHPLANQIDLPCDQLAARKQLGLPELAQVTGVLPGSRMSEINQMITPYLQAAVRLAIDYPDMIFVIPAIHQQARQVIEAAIDNLGCVLNVKVVDKQAHAVMAASDQVMVTSGTATLEAALMQRPMVLAIKVHPISYWLMKRLATTQWIGLPNILAGESLVTELIQQDATPEKLAHEMKRVIEDKTLRAKQLAAFKAQYISLKQNASQLAANAIVDWAKLP